jgi:hypothetical protein
MSLDLTRSIFYLFNLKLVSVLVLFFWAMSRVTRVTASCDCRFVSAAKCRSLHLWQDAAVASTAVGVLG